MIRKNVRIVVVGAAWYGDWAKLFYQACLRRGLAATIVYNNSVPATWGGNKDSVVNVLERAKMTLRRVTPRLFRYLKTARQFVTELEVLFRAWLSWRKDSLVVFIWTPGSHLVLKLLRALTKAKLILWLGEPVVRDDTWEEKFDYFDRVFMVGDGLWREVLWEKNKKRVELLPLASDHNIFFPAEVAEEYKSDIVFIGKYLPSRAKSLEAFREYNLKIYGYGWEMGFLEFPWLKDKWGGSLPIDKSNLVYNGAKIAIGTLGMPKDSFTTTTQRTFDIALSGVFQVSERVPLTYELFGESIGFYKDDEDLKRKVEYYLERPEERMSCAKRARAIALNYTYDKSVDKIIGSIIEK